MSDGVTQPKSPLAWLGTPERRPSRQVLGLQQRSSGLFQRAPPQEAVQSPAPPQKSQLLAPPPRGSAQPKAAGTGRHRHRQHAAAGDRRNSRDAAVRDALHSGMPDGSMGARSHFFSTPAAASATPPPRLPCADSYASDRGDGDMLSPLPVPPPSPALRCRSISTQPWSPMLGASIPAGSLAAQGAGLLRIADGGPSDMDVRWQLRKGSLPAMPQVPAPAPLSTASSMSQLAAQAQHSLAALSRLRRHLRQLDPGLSVAPPAVLSPSQSAVAAPAGDSKAAPTALPTPRPPRLTSRGGIEDALLQLQRHQQQARVLQSAADGKREGAAARKQDLASLADHVTRRHECLQQAPSEPSSSASSDSWRTPSAATSALSTGLSAQLQKLRLLQGQGAALAGAVAAHT